MRTSSEVHFARDVQDSARALLGDLASPVDQANASTAVAVLHALKAGAWSLSEAHIAEGVKRHRDISGQRGRWQRVDVKGTAMVVLDGAHNLDGVRAITAALAMMVKERGGRLHVVWGTVGDKDPSEVMALLPVDASYRWCAADIPRAMAVDRVAAVRPELKGESHDTPVAALLAVLDEAEERDVIWVGGSLFVVGDLLRDAPGVIPGWPNDDGSVT